MASGGIQHKVKSSEAKQVCASFCYLYHRRLKVLFILVIHSSRREMPVKGTGQSSAPARC